MQFSVVVLIVCVQIFDVKHLTSAQTVTNERLDPDIINYRITNSANNPLTERVNQIRSTLMALLKLKVNQLQQQMVPIYTSAGALTNAMLTTLQQTPRPYIAQALIAPSPGVPPGAMWLAQAGVVVPQPGLAPAAAQPLVFRPIAQFAFTPTAQQLAAAAAPLAAAAAPLLAQMGTNPTPAALAATVPGLLQGLPALVTPQGLTLAFPRPPLTGLPGSPQTTPGSNLGQPLGAAIGQLSGANLATLRPGSNLGQILGANSPIPQQGATSGQPLGANLPIPQPGAVSGQPLGTNIPIPQAGSVPGLPSLSALQNLRPGSVLGQPVTAIPSAQQPSPLLSQPAVTQPTPQPAASTPAAQLGTPQTNGQVLPTLPTTLTGSTPQEQIVNVVPVPQPGATPPVQLPTPAPLPAAANLPAVPQVTVPSPPSQPTNPTEPRATPRTQLDGRPNPRALLLV